MGGASPPLKAEDFAAVAGNPGARAKVGREVPFAEQPIREAVRLAASHHPGGKIIINMESTP